MRLRPALAAIATLATAGASGPALADPSAPTAGYTLAPGQAPATGAADTARAPTAPDARTTSVPDTDEQILVQAKRRNQTEVTQGGQLGALGTMTGLDAPFSIVSYNSALILNQQDKTLGQVLQNDPSVRTSLGYGNFSETFVIRGFPVYGDDVGIDGLYGIAPRQLVDPQLFEQVQVLNGANAFLNGAAPGGSSIGGGVNLVMKRAGAQPLMRVTGSYDSDSIGGGAVDMGRRFGADDQFGARINVAGSSGHDAIDDEHRDTLVVGGAFDWRRDRLRVSLDVDYQDKGVNWGRTAILLSPTATRVPTPPRAATNYGQPWAFTRLRDRFGILHADYDLLSNVSLYAAAGLRDGDENGDYSTLTVSNGRTGAGTSGRLAVPRTDDNESVRGGVRARVDTGPVHHELNLGGSSLWEVGRYAYAFSAAQADNLYRPIYYAAPNPTSLVGGDLNDPFPINRTRLQSVYGSDTLRFLDDRALLIVGVRQQKIVTHGYAYGGGGRTSTYDSGRATPVVGVVVHPTRETSIYFNRIEGLQPGPVATGVVTNIGQIFPAFTSVQYEVGAKIDLRRVSSSLAIYQIDQPNSYSRANGDGTLTFVVDGQQRNRGLEWKINAEPLHGLRVIGGATYTDARLRRTGTAANDGNQAIGVPDYLLNANLEYDLPFLRGGTLTGQVIRTGSQQVNVGNTLQLHPWTVASVGARYTFVTARHPVTVRVGVNNITNERYWDSALGGVLTQGVPRAYTLSVSADL
ncbi:TonB-dependent receptor [Rhizosaccharibacter radicis]|uniref:TonB-dependent receptor n=1 Tax=Rhizosaccharibacter radicis TaxID=2782605 RepID=A0ABT1VYW9_9PROT|nr:TonB-dependent receptor [Acetobacteraceae bacterium KSS12]